MPATRNFTIFSKKDHFDHTEQLQNQSATVFLFTLGWQAQHTKISIRHTQAEPVTQRSRHLFPVSNSVTELCYIFRKYPRYDQIWYISSDPKE